MLFSRYVIGSTSRYSGKQQHQWDPLLDSSNIEINGDLGFTLATPSSLTSSRLGSCCDGDRAQLHGFRRLRSPPWNRYHVLFLQRAQLPTRRSRKDRGQSIPFVPDQNFTLLSQILTGAQIPLSQLRNDAVDNLLGALTIAGHYIIPGTLAFSRSWLRIHCFQSVAYTLTTLSIAGIASPRFLPMTSMPFTAQTFLPWSMVSLISLLCVTR